MKCYRRYIYLSINISCRIIHPSVVEYCRTLVIGWWWTSKTRTLILVQRWSIKSVKKARYPHGGRRTVMWSKSLWSKKINDCLYACTCVNNCRNLVSWPLVRLCALTRFVFAGIATRHLTIRYIITAFPWACLRWRAGRFKFSIIALGLLLLW